MTEIELILTVLSIIIGCVSLLFTFFMLGLAGVAFWGWKNAKDINKIKKQAETEYKQICNNASDFGKKLKEANVMLEGIKKGGDKKHLKEQEQKLGELVGKMDKIIETAENKLSSLEVHNLSTTPFISTGNLATDYPPTLHRYSIAGGEGMKPCKMCRQYFYSRGLNDDICEDCDFRK